MKTWKRKSKFLEDRNEKKRINQYIRTINHGIFIFPVIGSTKKKTKQRLNPVYTCIS